MLRTVGKNEIGGEMVGNVSCPSTRTTRKPHSLEGAGMVWFEKKKKKEKKKNSTLICRK